jgi:hypothetical protein
VNVRWYIMSVTSPGISSTPCNTQHKVYYLSVSPPTHPIIHVAITYMSVFTVLINLFSLYCPSYTTVNITLSIIYPSIYVSFYFSSAYVSKPL